MQNLWRPSGPLCLLCRFASSATPQWRQIRGYAPMARAQKRRPARMELSRRVARPGPVGRERGDRMPAWPRRDENMQAEGPDRRAVEKGTPTTGSRKERRAAHYKDVILEREKKVQSQARELEKRGKLLDSNYPLWAPGRAERRRRKPNDGGFRNATGDRPRPGPFGALNQRKPMVDERKTPGGGRADARASAKKSNRDGKESRSPGEYHSLKMQQALTTVGYGARNQIKTKIDEVESFESFSLLPSLQDAISKDALRGMTDITPTPIQSLAIPALLGTENGSRRRRKAVGPEEGRREFLLAAETGSGKTMAYLVPVVDAIKRTEAEQQRIEEGREAKRRIEGVEFNPVKMFELDPPKVEDSPSNVAKPKVIVLVPTAELVEQVGALAKAMSHNVKFRTNLISSNYSQTVIKNRLFSETDVLVSTPYLLSSVSETEPEILSQVTHLIIDEADSLLDRSFAPTTGSIIDKTTSTVKQLIFCSATIPKRMDNFLRDRFPDTKRLTTPNLHAIPRRVQLGVVDVEKEPYKGKKDLACADVIWKIGSSTVEQVEDGNTEKVQVKRILVFVNEREKSVELAEYLVGKGIDAVALNRDLDTRNQTQLLLEFCSLSSSNSAKAPSAAPRSVLKKPSRQLPHTKVLVCTDIASRGIDTTAVRHVLLYDVPHTSIDFIHRLGRTGRMGRRGRGVVLVGKDDNRAVVREIREAMFRGAALI